MLIINSDMEFLYTLLKSQPICFFSTIGRIKTALWPLKPLQHDMNTSLSETAASVTALCSQLHVFAQLNRSLKTERKASVSLSASSRQVTLEEVTQELIAAASEFSLFSGLSEDEDSERVKESAVVP